MVREAHQTYVAEVMNLGKRYERFAEDFLNSNLYHDAEDALSKNQHAKNYAIIKGLLLRKELVQKYFVASDLKDEDIKHLLNIHDTTAPPSLSVLSINRTDSGHSLPAIFVSGSSSDFKPNIPSEAIDLIVHCVNEAGLFREKVSQQDMLSFFSCATDKKFISSNSRLVAMFFDGIAEKCYITDAWQHVIEQHQLIISSSGKKLLTAKDLSSSLYQNNEKTSKSKEKALSKLLEMLPNVD